MKCFNCEGNFVGLNDNGLCGYCNDKMIRDCLFINYDKSEWFYNSYYNIILDKEKEEK